MPLTRGSANDCPHDRYSAQLNVEITVPDGVELPPLPGDGSRLGDGRLLTLYVASISLDSGLRDWTLPESEGPTGSYYDQYVGGPRSVQSPVTRASRAGA